MLYEKKFHTPDLISKSVLITGGAGFIGSNIAEYLMMHGVKKIRVLDNLSNGFRKNIEPFLSHPSFEFIEGDITDFEICRRACDGMQLVTHQAALGSVPRSIKNPLATHQANATGFLNMIEAAREAKIEKFIYASSSSVYGDSPDLPKRENKTGNALSPYAVSKQTNELYANVFALNYGMKVIGLRYFNVFGPRQDPNGPYAAAIPLFMNALLHGKKAVIFGDGNQTRDFTFVQNAVQANIRALCSSNESAFGKVYNVAVGENVSVKNLFYELAKIAGSNAQPEYQSERIGDIRNSLADIALAMELLGYSPEIKMKEGLAITFEWFKNNF